jgi:phosphatidate cytidylyltransferase
MTSDRGVFYLLFVVLGTTMTDIGAYFVGKFFGRHNAGLKVSPKKTYEGYAGGLVAAAVSLVLYIQIVPGLMGLGYPESFPGILETVVISLLLSFASIAGDLSESALKRDAKIKDSASLIPGHGGFLDLADALFFTVPLFYYYLTIRQSLGISV